jgi:hypothetical protein
MPREGADVKEGLVALVMRPRAVQRCHQVVPCEGNKPDGAPVQATEALAPTRPAGEEVEHGR